MIKKERSILEVSCGQWAQEAAYTTPLWSLPHIYGQKRGRFMEKRKKQKTLTWLFFCGAPRAVGWCQCCHNYAQKRILTITFEVLYQALMYVCCESVCLWMCLCLYFCECVWLRMSVTLSVCMSLTLSVRMSLSLYLCLSVYGCESVCENGCLWLYERSSISLCEDLHVCLISQWPPCLGRRKKSTFV